MRLKPDHIFVLLLIALLATAASTAYDQTVTPTNSLPNPYRSVENWAKLPQGRTWGSTSAVAIDPDGSSVWVGERCGAQGFIPPSQMKEGVPFNCDGSKLAPILKFDAAGKLVKSFGEELLVFPHGLHVDREGNVWVTDGVNRGPKGQQVLKFSPDGKLLLRLGKPGVAGAGNDEFNAPSAVVTAPNGDIFVADGHGGNTNARIVKFSKDGKFIKSWGKKGSGPGELDIPHAIAMDSQGRLFVGDRNNNRIQIFDQDGKYLAEWKQFSRPSGVFIDKNDVIYVADSESESVRNSNPGWKRGIRVGNAKTGEVTALIPDPVEKITGTSAAEGVAADAMGNIYGAEVGPKRLMKYVKN
jgi:sugar lactone lactonase YvrE